MSGLRKTWTVSSIVRNNDYFKLNQLLANGDIRPTRMLVDDCYCNYASKEILEVLVKFNAPMSPKSILDLDPLTHYAVSFVRMVKMNFRMKKKLIDSISYFIELGLPNQDAIEALEMIGTPPTHDIYSHLHGRRASPLSSSSVSGSSTTSTSSSLCSADSIDTGNKPVLVQKPALTQKPAPASRGGKRKSSIGGGEPKKRKS